MNQDKIGRWTAAALVCGFFIWWISAIPTPTRQPGLVNAAEPVSTPAEHPAGGPILYIQHETEARRFLRECNQKRSADRQECLRLQRTFVIVYVGSFTGGFFQIVTLAAALSSPTSRNYMKQVAPAVRPDPIESCAWWTLLSLTTAHNPEYDATITAIATFSPATASKRAFARSPLSWATSPSRHRTGIQKSTV